MKYTSEVFQRLSHGQFISANSIMSETRAIYNDIEDNEKEYADYFSQIDFQLESGDGYYYFARMRLHLRRRHAVHPGSDGGACGQRRRVERQAREYL